VSEVQGAQAAAPPPRRGKWPEVAAFAILVLLLGSILWAILAHRASTPAKEMLERVDQALISLRHGSESGARASWRGPGKATSP